MVGYDEEKNLGYIESVNLLSGRLERHYGPDANTAGSLPEGLWESGSGPIWIGSIRAGESQEETQARMSQEYHAALAQKETNEYAGKRS